MSTVTAYLASGARVELRTEHHTWHADEPLELGGTGEGPTPYEQLLGSLAACTAITLKLYAGHKGIDLKWIKAEYEFDRVYADDCANCADPATGFIERIQARVTVAGSFTDAQQKRLTEIAKRCPVHKTLAHGMRIDLIVSPIDG